MFEHRNMPDGPRLMELSPISWKISTYSMTIEFQEGWKLINTSRGIQYMVNPTCKPLDCSKPLIRFKGWRDESGWYETLYCMSCMSDHLTPGMCEWYRVLARGKFEKSLNDLFRNGLWLIWNLGRFAVLR